MTDNFHADEVFEMAEQIERNGAAFYREAAGRFEDERTRHLLLNLALMEEDHEKTFSRMRAQFLPEAQKTFYDPADEAIAYLRSFVKDKIFSEDKHSEFSEDKTDLEIVGQAISLEKESIVFYLAMKRMVSQEWGSDHIDYIIREEMRHINILKEIDRHFRSH